MPPWKQQKRNGFMLFTRCMQDDWRRRGDNMSPQEALTRANHFWQSLSDDEKQEWRDKAKEERGSARKTRSSPNPRELPRLRTRNNMAAALIEFVFEPLRMSSYFADTSSDASAETQLKAANELAGRTFCADQLFGRGQALPPSDSVAPKPSADQSTDMISASAIIRRSFNTVRPHVPLIKFLGKRPQPDFAKTLAAAPMTSLISPAPSAVVDASKSALPPPPELTEPAAAPRIGNTPRGSGIDEIFLPAHLRRKLLSQDEIDAINTGGLYS